VPALAREAAVAVVADLVVAELAVVVVVREAAVRSSPRWRCWSPIAVVALVVVVAELVVLAVVAVVVLEARRWWRSVIAELAVGRWSSWSRWWWR
jgi:hypothetical protein